MGAAVAWGICAVPLAPKLTKRGADEQVAALPSQVEFRALTAESANAEEALSNPNELKRVFAQAVTNAQSSSQGLLTLDKQPAKVDLDTLKTSINSSGLCTVGLNVSVGRKKATVFYSAKQTDTGVTFVPSRVVSPIERRL